MAGVDSCPPRAPPGTTARDEKLSFSSHPWSQPLLSPLDPPHPQPFHSTCANPEERTKEVFFFKKVSDYKQKP